MKRIFPLILFIFGAHYSALAQTDSIKVRHTDWKVTRLAPGVKLKTFLYEGGLFGASQNVSIVEIKPRKKNLLDLAYSEKQLIPTDEFGRKERSLAAINGTFFDMSNGGSVDYVRSDGRTINENRLNSNGSRAAHQKAAVTIHKGTLSIDKWDGTTSWESRLQGEDVMVSGPLLILDQVEEQLDSNSFNNTRHPRSAIAVTENNRVLLVTVDGRAENSAGMSLRELSKYLRWLKADDAINLDGGGSTALWVGSKKLSGIVNYPSDNKKWDHDGVRKVANVILLRRK